MNRIGSSKINFLNWKVLVASGASLVALAVIFINVFALTVSTGLLYATGLTAPGAEIWLSGSLGGHLWVADLAQGFCRLDAAPGLASTLINPATCAKPDNISPGQAVYDSVTQSIYLPDAAKQSQGMYRLQYDPASETIVSSMAIAAGLIASDDGPQSAAFGPDRKLYLGLIKKGRIVRLTTPNANSQTLEAVGVTSNGLPAASLSFAGNDLYLAEAVNVTRLVNAAQCSSACVAAKLNVAVLGPRGFAFDPASLNLYIADFSHVYRYNLNSQVLDLYANSGTDPNNVAVLFKDIHSLGFDPQNNVLVGENASLGSLAGQIWQLFPNLVPVIDPELGDPLRPIASLKTVPVPEPANLMDFVADRATAIQLGKALFWDMQVGSDGVQACASCHFQAGADIRAKNQIDPGVRANPSDSTFQLAGPNYTLKASDFPLTKHIDPNISSPITSDTNDVISSQGVMLRDFVGIIHKQPFDNCTSVPDSVFNVGGINVRRVEPRNTPSVINAVFNNRNFWDGRANNIFNGVNPFGPRDIGAKIWKTINNSTSQVTVAIPYSSLASQAVGPPGSFFEMSCDTRTLADIGHKLLGSKIKPLGQQIVDPTDSVLGSISGMRLHKPVLGLNVSYKSLVKKAFRAEYWQAAKVGDGTYSQMEANFSMIFGLAIQMYESTLVSDNTPFDQFMAGNGAALTARQQIGLSVFVGQGRCVACHAGPELTKASVGSNSLQHLERMVMGNGGCAIYDNGFYNIGVRPTADDIGLGGQDPFGNPLSEAGMAMLGKFTDPNLTPLFGNSGCDTRANVDGTFKTPSLRNVELNGPYFQNGGQATLREVVDFYNRGGDFGQQNLANFDPNIEPLGLTEDMKVSLVDFLTALTDERVRWEKAPFDHPQLCIPNGQVGDTEIVNPSSAGSIEATDSMLCLPATGTAGATKPLSPFLGLDPMSH